VGFLDLGLAPHSARYRQHDDALDRAAGAGMTATMPFRDYLAAPLGTTCRALQELYGERVRNPSAALLDDLTRLGTEFVVGGDTT